MKDAIRNTSSQELDGVPVSTLHTTSMTRTVDVTSLAPCPARWHRREQQR